MRTAKVKPLDVAVIALACGMLVGLVARLVENSRQLAGLFGF